MHNYFCKPFKIKELALLKLSHASWSDSDTNKFYESFIIYDFTTIAEFALNLFSKNSNTKSFFHAVHKKFT